MRQLRWRLIPASGLHTLHLREMFGESLIQGPAFIAMIQGGAVYFGDAPHFSLIVISMGKK